MAGVTDFQIITKDQLNPVSELIGRGAFGAVYRAMYQAWNIDVAVKVCNENSLDAQQNILEEARKLSKANHKNIIRLYGLCITPGFYGLVMEYIENGSLERLLRDIPDVFIPWVLRWRFILEICTGMNVLHNLSPQKVLHLDLKAANVLIDEHYTVKISDFGLSRLRSCHSAGIMVNGPGGTITHFPPEYFQSASIPISEKFDVYSFGILIWEILSREEPYKEAIGTGHIRMAVSMNNDRPNMDAIPKDLPEDMKKDLLPLMEKCWDGNPQNRPFFKDMLALLTDVCKTNRSAILRAVTQLNEGLEKAGKAESALCHRFDKGMNLEDAVRATQEKFGSIQHPSANVSYSPQQPSSTATLTGQQPAPTVSHTAQAVQDTRDASVRGFHRDQLQRMEETDAAKSIYHQDRQPEMYRYVFGSQQSTTQPTMGVHQPVQMQQPMQPPVPMQAGMAMPYNMMMPAHGQFMNVQGCYGVMYGGQGNVQNVYPPKPVSKPEPILPKEPEKTVTPKVLLSISKEIGSHWKNLARLLGFSDPQIDTIEIDHFHYGAQEQSYQMLHRWYQKTGRNAKHKVLAEALNDISRGDLIVHL